MKRDMDLVRALLRHIERMPPTKGRISTPEIEGYTEEQVGYHAYIMAQGGLIEVADVTPLDQAKQWALPLSLTWDGHEFLDAANDDTLWAKAKEHVIGPAGTAGFGLLLEWLKAEARAKLGLPP